jgi:hypothetical protein
VHSVHVALDRQDCAEKHSKVSEATAQARTAFADPKSSDRAARTLEGEMLSEVAGNWKNGNLPENVTPTVVVEMLPGIPTPAARKEHATIVANVRSIMDAA